MDKVDIIQIIRECPKCGYPTDAVRLLDQYRERVFNAGLERAAEICENIEFQSHEIRFTTKSNWVEIIKLDVAAAILKEKK